MAAAEDVWKAVKTFYRSLPELNDNITSKTFNLATQSYGGHWGPVFFNYIRKQNDAESDDVLDAQYITWTGKPFIYRFAKDCRNVRCRNYTSSRFLPPMF